MYKIKQKPEDFIVDEITNIETKESGRYIYYRLKKRNYTVIRALQHIARVLNIPLRRIGFAGTKDKYAITTQYISFDSVKKEKIDKIKLKDIELDFFGYDDKPISLGDLKENKFTITIRDIEKKPKEIKKIINYFGSQRFSKNNVEVGLALLKKDFKRAVELVGESDPEFMVASEIYLKAKPNDYIGLLRKIPKKLLMLYIHSYQGYVWNETVKSFVDNNIEKEKIIIVGFGSDLENEEVIKSLIEKDGINERDFIIRNMPDLSSEGDIRNMFAEIKNLEISDIEKKRCVVKFRLPKGSYATVAIDQMIQGQK